MYGIKVGTKISGQVLNQVCIQVLTKIRKINEEKA